MHIRTATMSETTLAAVTNPNKFNTEIKTPNSAQAMEI